jgi:hypothetical protein
MNSNTQTLFIAAPSEQVFNFLSNIENLPKWATMFCQQLKPDGHGRHKVLTPQGEIFFHIKADKKTGVIDMYGGPRETEMACWPTRVVAAPDKGSLFIFTAFQYPGVSDAEFAQQCAGLAREFPLIKKNVE